MTLFQKLKLILQLLFICTVFFINAAVYQKYNYSAPSTHLRYIPTTTVLSITLNVNKISGQFINRFFFKNEEMTGLLEDLKLEKNENKDLFSGGIDATSQVSFFITNNLKSNGFKYAGLMVDLFSRTGFEDQLKAKGFKKIVDQETSVFQKSASVYAVCNDQTGAFIYFKDSTYQDADKKSTLSKLLQEEKLNPVRDLIITKIKENHDVVVYGLPQNLSEEQLWMHHFVACGELKGDAFEFSFDMEFNSDITAYFPEHQTNPKFNFTDLDGYCYMNSVFRSGNAAGIFDKMTLIKMNDSLESLLKPALKGQSANGLTLYSYDLAKASFKVKEDSPLELRLLSKNFFLPAFDFKLHCSSPSQIDTVFGGFVKNGKLSKTENGWYQWKRDEHYNLFFTTKKDWLNVTTKPNDQNQWPETGFSNVFYFNADQFNDKLPDMTARFMADQFRVFEYCLVYSSKAEKNKLSAKGKLVFVSGSDSVMEILKLMIRFKDFDLAAIGGLAS